MRLPISGILALLVSACGGDDSSGNAGYCVGSFYGGSTSWGCNNCSGLDPLDDYDDFSPAIDDNAGTYTEFAISPSGQVTVTATAPSGTTFPAGVDAGALMRFPSGTFTSISVRFNTYNGSTPVDSAAGGAGATGGNVPGAGTDTYYELNSSGPFDRLEAVISASGGNATFRVYEFCGDR